MTSQETRQDCAAKALLDAIALREERAALALAQGLDVLAPIGAEGHSALSRAVAANLPALVQAFLDRAAPGPLEREGAIPPLFAAASLRDEEASLAMIELVIDRSDPRRPHGASYGQGDTPIMAAASKGHVRAIGRLGKAAPPWECAAGHSSPLFRAAEQIKDEDGVAVIEAVLAFGREREQCADAGLILPPLGACVMRGQRERARALIPFSDHGPGGESGKPPAFYAVESARFEILQDLLPWAPFPCVDARGQPLLHAARAQLESRPHIENVIACADLVERWWAAQETRLALDAQAAPAPARAGARL